MKPICPKSGKVVYARARVPQLRNRHMHDGRMVPLQKIELSVFCKVVLGAKGE